MLTNPVHHSPFYGILDTGYVKPESYISKCKALIEGGAGIVQLRAKKQSHEERIDIIETILPLFNKNGPALIINDDLELALKYKTIGLHIGQEDISAKEARNAMGNKRILGLSTHSPEQAEEAIALSKVLNYFAVGPVFATQTKPHYVPVGLELVQYVAKLKPQLPWYCIGGINRKNARQIKNAGGQKIVVVSDVLCDNDTQNAVKTLVSAMQSDCA